MKRQGRFLTNFREVLDICKIPEVPDKSKNQRGACTLTKLQGDQFLNTHEICLKFTQVHGTTVLKSTHDMIFDKRLVTNDT